MRPYFLLLILLFACAAPAESTPRPIPASLPKPMSRPETVSAPEPRRLRVVLDAGHGGEDTGAISPDGTREKTIALDIAQLMDTHLRAQGVDVLLTRETDVFVSLSRRAELANRFRADLFVSIHANASEARSLHGFEVYTLSEEADDGAIAMRRAEKAPVAAAQTRNDRGLNAILWDMTETENRKRSLKAAEHVSAEVGRSVVIAAKRVRRAQFYVLKWTECPAVLVETGYITNGEDERRLKSPIYRKHLAHALARGILAYKEHVDLNP